MLLLLVHQRSGLLQEALVRNNAFFFSIECADAAALGKMYSFHEPCRICSLFCNLIHFNVTRVRCE